MRSGCKDGFGISPPPPPPPPPHPRKKGGGGGGGGNFIGLWETLNFHLPWGGANTVFSGGWRESLSPVYSPHQRFIPPNPLNSAFLLKIFFSE